MSPPPEDAADTPRSRAARGLGWALLRAHGVKLALSLTLGGGFVWVLSRGGLPVLPPNGALSKLDGGLVVLAFLAFLLSNVARVHRARWLMAPIGDVPARILLPLGWASNAAVLLAPFRIGEFVRPMLFASRTRLSFMEVAGTLFAERLLDGITLSALLLGALSVAHPLDPLPHHVGDLPISPGRIEPVARTVALAFSAAAAGTVVFYRFRRLTQRLIEATLGRLSSRLSAWASALVERFTSGLAFLPSARLLGAFALESVVYWGAHIGGISLLARAAGLPALDLERSTVVAGVMGMGVLVPAAPGFFGSFQLATFVALSLYVPPSLLLTEGALFVFAFYVLHIGTTLGLGLCGLVADPAMLGVRRGAAVGPADAGAPGAQP